MLIETKTSCDEVLSERLDVKQLEQKWFSVIIAAGHFVVRAFAQDEAVLKSEVYANDLRLVKVDIGQGMPLVMDVMDDASRFYDSVWHSGKPDVTLIGFSEDTSYLLPEKQQHLAAHSGDGAQLTLPFA